MRSHCRRHLITGVLIVFAALGLFVTGARAAAAPAQHFSPPAAGENQACLGCHQNPQLNVILGTKQEDVLSLFVDPAAYGQSVHGELGLTCLECHNDFEPTMGHGLSFGSSREVALSMNRTCANCHKVQANQEKESIHAAARAVGTLDAAVCTDCHSAHAVRRLNNPINGQLLPETRFWIPTTCRKCHSAIYDKYRNSVHGNALVNGNNQDVPTCIDCHGVHMINNPTTTAFRTNSPQTCAKCHTDAKIMDQYGISTQVVNTYVADFHGTTVTLFERLSPDAVTNKPVCYDCHGIHDIVKVDDPRKGLLVKANLQAACQKCHPDANVNFPDSWMSHYIPNPEKYPIVYYINLFYKFFIPAVLLPMAALVVMDFGRMMINRFKKPAYTGIHGSTTEHPRHTGEEAHYDD